MTHGIRCIVGLGNPGDKYAATRHNAGFWYVDQLARDFHCILRAESRFFGEAGKVNITNNDVWLLKPSTYMNRSGQSVSAFMKYYRMDPEELLVAHDDLDLPPGTARIKTGGGHGGHNGLRDICSALGSKQFHRLRIGIGHPGHRDRVVDYVLNRPGRTEQQAIEDAIRLACQNTDLIVTGDFQKAMNSLHRNKPND